LWYWIEEPEVFMPTKHPGGLIQKGFTLMELMFVVAIIAFVSAAVVPSFSSNLQRSRQREAGNLIIQGVIAARTLAPRLGRVCRVSISLSETQDKGGNGGRVQVFCAANENRCTRASFDPSYNSFSNKCVGCAGSQLVGADVCINNGERQILSTTTPLPVGSTVQIFFGPDGGMCNPAMYRFVIRNSNDVFRTMVSIAPGGDIAYRLCRGTLCY
jgi:prepilin-type N-terminal cleavage/methylation domain-containing protein